MSNMNPLMDCADGFLLEGLMAQHQGFQWSKTTGGVESTKKNLLQMTNNYLKMD